MTRRAIMIDQASRIMADRTRHNVGSVTRSVNIPTLALMFLHPDIRPRSTFAHDGDETLAGRAAWVLETTYREDAALQFWVPGQMDEHYVAGSDADELPGAATYPNCRRFTVNTYDALRKLPLE